MTPDREITLDEWIAAGQACCGAGPDDQPPAPSDGRAAGVAADAAGRYAEAYRLLIPLAEAGDTEAAGIVGSYLVAGMHRAESLEQLQEGRLPEPDAATHAADQERAVHFLRLASAAGSGAATFNLAGLVAFGAGGGSWDERKGRAAELYALAHTQGFTAFGHLTHAAGAGQPYLDLMEQYADAAGIPRPGDEPSLNGPTVSS